MKKYIIKTMIYTSLLFAGITQFSFGAVKPPPDLAYIKSLGNQDMIIGEYIVYMPKLTQEIYDAALLTTSEQQKIYYKSEFGSSNWFQIDDSSELLDIQVVGNQETISEEEISQMYFIIQVPQAGDELIYFMDSGAATTRFDEKTEALEESILALNASLETIKKQSVSSDTNESLEGLLAEVDYTSAQLDAFNTSVGKGPEAEEETLPYLSQDDINLLNAEIEVLRELAVDAESKGFLNLADAAQLEVMGKLNLLLEDTLAKSEDPLFDGTLVDAGDLNEEIEAINTGVDLTVPNTELGGLKAIVNDTVKTLVQKALLDGQLDTIGLQNSITTLLNNQKINNNEVVMTLMNALSDIECAACAQGLHGEHGNETESATGSDAGTQTGTGTGTSNGLTDGSLSIAEAAKKSQLLAEGLTSELLGNSIAYNLDQLLELMNLKLEDRLNTLSAVKSKEEDIANNVLGLNRVGLLKDLNDLDPDIGQKLEQLKNDLGLNAKELPSLRALNTVLSGEERVMLSNALDNQANQIARLLDSSIESSQQIISNMNDLGSTAVSVGNLVDQVRDINNYDVGSENPSLEFDYVSQKSGYLNHSESMSKDLEKLLLYLSNYENSYKGSLEDEILELMKTRYSYLIDYELEKVNDVGISLDVLDEKVRAYDLLVNQKRAHGFVDLYRVDLEFGIWVAMQQGQSRTEQLKRKELAAYKEELKLKIQAEYNLYDDIKKYYSTGLYEEQVQQNILWRIEKLQELKSHITNN